MNFKRLKSLSNQKKYPILKVKPWQLIEVHEKIWEWSNARIWKLKWLVIKVRKPNLPDWSFTIRWTVARVWVEKIYPLSFPNFEKVILLDEYKVRRSKLYYIREKIWKDAKMKSIIDPSRKWIDLLAEAVNCLENELKKVEKEKKVENVVEKKVEANIEEKSNEVEEVKKDEVKIEKEENIEPKEDKKIEDVKNEKEENLEVEEKEDDKKE